MKSLIPISILLATGSVAFGQSIPTKSPVCASKTSIRPVKDGAGAFFDADCKTAYVLPPVHGLATIDSVVGNMNLAQCGELKSLNQSVAGLLAKIQAIDSVASDDDEQVTASVGPGADLPQDDFPTMDGPFSNGSSSGKTKRSVTAPAPTVHRSAEAEAELKSLVAELIQLKQMRDTYGAIEGATAHMVYDLKIEDLVKRYQEANPGIHFEPMLLQRAYLSVNAKDQSTNTGSSAVISIDVPGLGRLPDAADISGLTYKAAAGERTPDTIDSKNTKIFGASLSGVMRLSLVGACPFYNSATRKLPSKIDAQVFSTHLAANLQYAYALQAFRRYTATYNLGVYASKLLESTTEGGFLRTSTMTSYIESTKTDDWFKITSESDDPRFYYPYLAQEIKTSMTDRVLKNIALTKVGGPVAPAGLGSPEANGASKAAEGLHKCPNLYCQAGAFFLDVLSSTAGSTSAANRFISDNNHTVVENVSEKVMLEYTGSGGMVGSN